VLSRQYGIPKGLPAKSPFTPDTRADQENHSIRGSNKSTGVKDGGFCFTALATSGNQPPAAFGLRQTRSNGRRQAWGATS
jgi:hypothetical protein